MALQLYWSLSPSHTPVTPQPAAVAEAQVKNITHLKTHVVRLSGYPPKIVTLFKMPVLTLVSSLLLWEKKEQPE